MILLSGLFFLAAAVVLGTKAFTNTSGLILNGILEFSPAMASLFYGILSALSILFVLTAGWVIFTTRVHGVPDVVLSDDVISFPAGYLIKRAFLLPYAQITGVSQTALNGQRLLVLHTAQKKHHIVLNWLGSRDAERALAHELTVRLAKSN